MRHRSNSADSWAVAKGSGSWLGAGLEWPPDTEDDSGDGAKEPQRHKAVRQESYLAAVRSPVTAGEVQLSEVMRCLLEDDVTCTDREFAYRYSHFDVFVGCNVLCADNVSFCGSGERMLCFLMTHFTTA